MASSGSAGLPFWEDGITVLHFHRRMRTALEEARRMPDDALQDLKARAFVSTVMVACEVENVPASVDRTPHEICVCLTALYKRILYLCPPHRPLDASQLWIFQDPWKGWSAPYFGPFTAVGRDFIRRRSQFLKALMFLCIYHRNDRLDEDLLMQTHVILLNGFRPLGQQVLPGQFRDSPIHENGAFFMHDSAISTSVTNMLCCLQNTDSNCSLDSGQLHNTPADRIFDFPDRLASFVHDMVQTQPFTECASWMCRLVMAHFLVSHEGFAFPVPIAPITDHPSEEFVSILLAANGECIGIHEGLASGFDRERAIVSAYILQCVCESFEELIGA